MSSKLNSYFSPTAPYFSKSSLFEADTSITQEGLAMCRSLYINGQEFQEYSNTLLIPACQAPQRYMRTRLKVRPLLIQVQDTVLLIFLETVQNHRIKKMFLVNPEQNPDNHCLPIFKDEITPFLSLFNHHDTMDMEDNIPSIWEKIPEQELSNTEYIDSIMNI